MIEKMNIRLRYAIICTAAACILLVLILLSNIVSAIPTNMVTGVSPSAQQVPDSSPWHSLVMTTHGKVQRVDVGMYFNNRGDKTFNINLPANFATNPALCTVSRPNSDYPLSNNYIAVEVPGRSPRFWTGNQICNGALDGSTYTIPSAALTQNYGDTRFWGATVVIRWVTGAEAGQANVRNDIARAGSGAGSHFRFRFNIAGQGRVASINTGLSDLGNANNSLVHVSGNATAYYPFGLSCGQSRVTGAGARVTVYDSDNGDVQSPPLWFWIGKVNSSGNVTPLERSDYRLDGSAVWVDEVADAGGSISRDNLNGLPLRYRGGTDPPGYLRFVPSNFGGVGGKTTVQLNQVDPRTHYVLVVNRLSGGQFIYVSLPGDGIFGSPDFNFDTDCPNNLSATAAPSTQLWDSTGSELLDGDTINLGEAFRATASITNGSSNAAYIDSAEWQVWLEAGDDREYNAGDLLVGGTWQQNNFTVPANGSYGGLPNRSGTANSPYRRLCTRITAAAQSTPPAPYGTSVSPTEVTKCVEIEGRPYFEVLNGDANAAANLLDGAGTCSQNTNGTISAFFRPSSPTNSARAQIAALANGTITDFGSANGVLSDGAYKLLTFANTGGGAAGSDFGGGANLTYCIPNGFWTNPAAGSQSISAGNPANPVVSVNGDLYITGDIYYPTANFAPENIPYYQFAARGNIYILSTVQHLDGVYAARGSIYTCATPSGSALVEVPDADKIARCGTPLQVSGSLIAGNGIKLHRLYSSVGGSPAEQIIYSPETWLHSINGSPVTTEPTTPKIDAITAQPPVL